MDTTAQRLDALMDDRRLELGLRWKQVTTRAGVTHQTLLQLRKGADVSDLTIANIERALEWEPGSIQSIRKGGDPKPATAEDAAPLSAPSREWDEIITGPHGPVEAGELLMWRDTPTGREYRLADADDPRKHAQYEFLPGETPEQVVDDLRRLLVPIRAIVQDIERRRDRAKP